MENFAKTCSRAISPRYPAFPPPPAKFTKARGPFRPPLRSRDIIFVAVREARLASPLRPTILPDKVVEITGIRRPEDNSWRHSATTLSFFLPPSLFLFPFTRPLFLFPSRPLVARQFPRIVLITTPTDHCNGFVVDRPVGSLERRVAIIVEFLRACFEGSRILRLAALSRYVNKIHLPINELPTNIKSKFGILSVVRSRGTN